MIPALAIAVLAGEIVPPEPLDLTPWVPAVLGVAAAIVAGVFAVMNRRGGEAARRQPTWVELTTENRLLRKEIRDAAEELRAARRIAIEAENVAGDLTDLRRDFEEFTEQVEARDRVTLLVLASAAEQWPAGTPGPTFDHIVDLDVIHDTLPPTWRRGTPRG